MPSQCPSCGAKTAAPDARFCRRCGAPLRAGGGQDTSPQVSPVAQTVPLTDEGRATDGLAAEESQRLGEGTSRIRRAEMDELLKRVAHEHAGSLSPTLAQGDADAKAVPVTSGLKTESASISPTTQASSRTRSGARRRWAVAALLCIVLGASLLAVILIRRSRASSATAVSSSEEIPPVVAAAAPAPQVEPPTVETSSQSNTTRPATGNTGEREAAAHPAAPARVISSSESPAPTPDARQTIPPPPPQPPSLSPSEHYQRGVQLWATDRGAALEEFRAAVPNVPDAYYYLGSEYYAEGRDVKTLGDGELRAALNYFLRATVGPHSAQSSRSAQLLGKEYERRKKKQSRP